VKERRAPKNRLSIKDNPRLGGSKVIWQAGRRVAASAVGGKVNNARKKALVLLPDGEGTGESKATGKKVETGVANAHQQRKNLTHGALLADQGKTAARDKKARAFQEHSWAAVISLKKNSASEEGVGGGAASEKREPSITASWVRNLAAPLLSSNRKKNRKEPGIRPRRIDYLKKTAPGSNTTKERILLEKKKNLPLLHRGIRRRQCCQFQAARGRRGREKGPRENNMRHSSAIRRGKRSCQTPAPMNSPIQCDRRGIVNLRPMPSTRWERSSEKGKEKEKKMIDEEK